MHSDLLAAIMIIGQRGHLIYHVMPALIRDLGFCGLI